MFGHEFCCTSGPWLSPSDYYVEYFWRRRNISPAVTFLRQMVTLLLFSLSTDFLNCKKNRWWVIGEHISLHFGCTYKRVHTEWSHFMSSVTTFQYSAVPDLAQQKGVCDFFCQSYCCYLKFCACWCHAWLLTC